MAKRNANLHGAVPARCKVALLLVDVINAMDFPGSKNLVRHATPASRQLARLRSRARDAKVPVIYANDNFGRWRSDFRATVENAQRDEVPGAAIAKLLEPHEQDYFVLKPKHSAFYGTSLELLLGYLGTERLVIAGFATDICVRFTVQDAFLRDFELVVPNDASASEQVSAHRDALAFMRDQLGARTPPTAHTTFQR